MKKLVLIVLIFTLLIGCLPFVSFSADSGVETEEYIYNSDLFYGYSTYLATPYNGALIALEQYRMQTTYNIISILTIFIYLLFLKVFQSQLILLEQ